MTRHRRTGPAYQTETQLCADFLANLEDGWVAYPETAGFDILLVRKADGFQIGVEAKLQLNAKVLSQALDRQESYDTRGPDCRAALIPNGRVVEGVPGLLPHLAVTVIEMRAPWDRGRHGPAYRPNLPTVKDRYQYEGREWFELCPTERCTLPEYVPDVVAGDKAPIQLTDWKIKAIKIAILLERDGIITRKHFKALRIDPRLWVDRGWVIASPDGLTSHRPPNFKRMHPKVYEEVAADIDKWLPKDLPPPPQAKLL